MRAGGKIEHSRYAIRILQSHLCHKMRSLRCLSGLGSPPAQPREGEKFSSRKRPPTLTARQRPRISRDRAQPHANIGRGYGFLLFLGIGRLARRQGCTLERDEVFGCLGLRAVKFNSSTFAGLVSGDEDHQNQRSEDLQSPEKSLWTG